MRQSLKVTLSILISLLLCGGFAVFSFTGFFEVLETSFFQPAIIEGREKQLQDFADRISGYHRDNIERFSPAVGKPFVWRAFADSNQQSTQDIIDLQNLFGTFLDEYPNLQLVRFLGKEGRKIHGEIMKIIFVLAILVSYIFGWIFGATTTQKQMRKMYVATTRRKNDET